MPRPLSFALGFVAGLAAAGLAAQAGTPRKVINLPTRNVQAPYSDAVLAGDTLYLAGKLGLDPKTGQAPKEAAEEAKLVLDAIQATLTAAGFAMDDLVTVQVFCSDVSLYDTFNGVYRTYFKSDPPARAFIGSGSLLRGARFEVQGVAVRR
jgi:reactive intermediate/imine deaminase